MLCPYNPTIEPSRDSALQAKVCAIDFRWTSADPQFVHKLYRRAAGRTDRRAAIRAPQRRSNSGRAEGAVDFFALRRLFGLRSRSRLFGRRTDRRAAVAAT
jgi:hypothetical protein